MKKKERDEVSTRDVHVSETQARYDIVKKI